MTGTAKRRRRLWDAYCFPGFRAEPTVCGVFGDPKARVIRLKRRSKKRRAAVAVASRWAGTTARFAGFAICRAATHVIDGDAELKEHRRAGVSQNVWCHCRIKPSEITSGAPSSPQLA